MNDKEQSQGWLIDENGFKVDSATTDGDAVNVITVPFPVDIVLHKPKWNDTNWIEGATQEEIDEITKVEPSPPTEEERIKELETIVNLLLMGGLK